MFDPRDLASDPRTRPEARPRRDHAREREKRERNGHRREYDSRRTKRQTFQDRTDRAVTDVGMYRNVAYRDLAEAHFEGHPYAARRAVDRMVRAGHVREHTAKGPQGGDYKVLTLTERGVERAERIARDQGLDKKQKAWSGLVKPGELQHDVAVFRAARIEQAKLLEQGAVLKRIRIEAELKREIARATESARAREGKEAADAARFEAAEALGLPVKDGRVEVPDAQLEYTDSEGRSGRVNVEIATEHYSAKSIGAKAAAGFAVHGSNGRAGGAGGAIARPGSGKRRRRRRSGQRFYRTLKGRTNATVEDQCWNDGHHPCRGPDDRRRTVRLSPASLSNHRCRLLDARGVVWRTRRSHASGSDLRRRPRFGLGRYGPQGRSHGALHSARRGGQTELATKLGQEDRGQFPGA